MKTVYVVTGSEDGIQGVYTNKKLAWLSACNYVKTESPVSHYDESEKVTYSSICKEHKKDGVLNVSIVDPNDTYGSAKIESMILNN